MITKQKQLNGALTGYQLIFDVLVEEIKDEKGFLLCENYGLRVKLISPMGETETKEITGITTSGKKMLTLFDRVTRGDVTPATLGDVVEDYMADWDE